MTVLFVLTSLIRITDFNGYISDIDKYSAEKYADKWIQKWDACEYYTSMNRTKLTLFFLATLFHALVEGASFKSTADRGFVRAMEIMNSKSSNDFRWSIRITDDPWIGIGIASKLKRTKDQAIYTTDENSIIFFPWIGNIWTGNRILHEEICKTKSGAECHFKFQPKMKKLLISFVSTIILTFLSGYKPEISERQRICC